MENHLACDDCNNNGIFDACEADCNPPGVCVDCTAGLGCGTISPDCNSNHVPDECDIDPTDPDNNGEVSADRNSNGIPDECEDCNGNGILDPCDLDCGVPGGLCAVPGCGLSADCNSNDILDECDIDMDSTAPGGPFFCDPAIETCDPDCNINGIPDACDIAPGGGSADIDSNGVPDECQEDCNFNGIFDFCDVSCGEPGGPCNVPNCGLSEDCNVNDVPDECDISSGASPDIDSNGVPDECEVDCNFNAIYDYCDIACGGPGGACDVPECGLSDDCNENNVPDECDVAFRGPIFLSGHDADSTGPAHCWGFPNACGDLYGALLTYAVQNSRTLPPEEGRILAVGVNDEQNSEAGRALAWFNDTANAGPGAALDFATAPAEIAAAEFAQFSLVYIPSSGVDPGTEGGITQVQLDALNLRQADLDEFVNFLGGGLVALTEAGLDDAYEWLPMPINDFDEMHFEGCPTAALSQIPGHAVGNCADLSPGGPYHNVFSGPPSFSGLTVLAVSDDFVLGRALLLGELNLVSEFDCDANEIPDVCQCRSDFNDDGTVGPFDLALVLGCWGPLPTGGGQCNCRLDVDGDGNIGPFDLAFVLGDWGPCP